MNTTLKAALMVLIAPAIVTSFPAFGAKPPETATPPGKAAAAVRRQAVTLPAPSAPPPGIPCKEERRWNHVTTFRGCDWPAPANKAATSSTDGASAFLKAHAAALGLRKDLADLTVVHSKSGLSQTTTRYQQTFQGLPVLNAFVTVQQRRSGRVTSLRTSYIKNPVVQGASTPSIDPDAASATALEGIGQQSGLSSPEVDPMTRQAPVLSWLPVGKQQLALVWVVQLQTRKPLGSFYTLVDAGSGERLLQEDRIAYAAGTGLAHVPNPSQTFGYPGDARLVDNGDATSRFLDDLRVPVELLGLNDSTELLIGEFVDLATYNAPVCPRGDGCPDARSATRAYHYDRRDARFEQVTVYRAIDSVQRYIRDTLGFENIRAFPTRANAHWDARDNSFYDPNGDSQRGILAYGDGGVDDAEDADIVVHEFGHAIQHDQNPSCWSGGSYVPQVNETRAMGEGFSDYLAASFFADLGDPGYQSAHAACVGEWDASSYSDTNPPCLRRVDGDKHYPEDLDGEEHDDGEIWSAVLWDIRARLGAAVTDQLVLEHHFGLACSGGATMPQAALEILDADLNLFAGAHRDVLATKFCDRGILTGNVCQAPTVDPVVYLASKDSTLLMRDKNRNEGKSPILQINGTGQTGDNAMRVVVGFDLAKIPDRSKVATAKLVLTVQKNFGGWGPKGRSVVARPLLAKNFAEGNGRSLGQTTWYRGTGTGITWLCRYDSDIANARRDCTNTPWAEPRAPAATSAPVVHRNDLLADATVAWDVTDDVKNGGTTSWLIRKRYEQFSGRVRYYAREGGHTRAPRLEITFVD